MRVLLLHNRYRAEGGEERAVAMQAELLGRHGHQVEVLERDSAGAGRRAAARGMLGGGIDADAVGAAVRRFRADVVHAHNIHPLFGWRALAAAQAAGARTVLQLHNFRLFCAIGVAYRNQEPCHACRGHDTRPGFIHRCRGGVAESAVYAAGLAGQLSRILRHVDGVIALSEGHLALLRAQGLDHPQVTLVPNFVWDADWAGVSAAAQGRHALVAGRLVEEKGFDTAILAAAMAGTPIVVAGDGPDALRLRTLAREHGTSVTFTGWIPAERLRGELQRAGAVLVPSRCEEAFGYGALDAFAAGVPVIASPRGGLAEMVRAGGGTLVDPDAPEAWGAALAALWSDPERRAREGEQGLWQAREHYGEAAALSALMRAYGADRPAEPAGPVGPRR